MLSIKKLDTANILGGQFVQQLNRFSVLQLWQTLFSILRLRASRDLTFALTANGMMWFHEIHVEHAENFIQTVNQAQFKTQDPGALKLQWYLLCPQWNISEKFEKCRLIWLHLTQKIPLFVIYSAVNLCLIFSWINYPHGPYSLIVSVLHTHHVNRCNIMLMSWLANTIGIINFPCLCNMYVHCNGD